MSLAHRFADNIVRRFGLKRPIDRPKIVSVPASRRRRLIGIRAGQSYAERLWQKGHELGHFLLHRGDQADLRDRWLIVRQERQAEDFTGWLFLGEAWHDMECWEMAERFGLPEERIRAWLNRRSLEIAVWQRCLGAGSDHHPFGANCHSRILRARGIAHANDYQARTDNRRKARLAHDSDGHSCADGHDPSLREHPRPCCCRNANLGWRLLQAVWPREQGVRRLVHLKGQGMYERPGLRVR